MTKQVEAIIRNACAVDMTINANAIDAAISLLKGTYGGPDSDSPITACEAATLLGVSTKTIIRYAERGIIRTIGSKAEGTRTRYSRKSVIAYLNGGTAKMTEVAA